MPEVRRHRSRRVGCAFEVAEVLELLGGPFGLALFLEHGRDGGFQFDEHFDVERGVIQPLLRQRSFGPVGGAVALLQTEPEQALHHRRQVHPVEAGQPAGQFGVVKLRRAHSDLGEARQVLVGGMQHPLVGGEHLGYGRQGGQGVSAVVDGVDQHGARAVAVDLHQVGPVRVTETGGAFGVDGERAVPGRKEVGGLLDLVRGHRQQRDTARGGEQGCGVGGSPLARLRRSRLRSSQARVRDFRSVTPAGGRPAACSSTEQNAATCGPSSSVVAVHDARSSSWWARGGPEMSP